MNKTNLEHCIPDLLSISRRFDAAVLILPVVHLLTLFFICFLSTAVKADDIEIYIAPPETIVLPNILLLIDSSERMQGDRSSVLISGLLDEDENIAERTSVKLYSAAMSFNSETSNAVLSSFEKTSAGKSFTQLAIQLEGINSEGAATITPALKRAVELFGDGRDDIESADVEWCAPNAIVLISQGLPETGTDPVAEQYRGTACNTNAPYANGDNTAGLCAEEISEYGFLTDMWSGPDYPGRQAKQNIVTYTVAVKTDPDTAAALFMQNIAYRGGGEFFPASTAGEISLAMNEVVKAASQSISYSYTPPEILPDEYRTVHSNGFIYVPVFRPEASTYWKGNLLKFKTGTKVDGLNYVEDQNGLEIKDLNIHQKGLQDYWSADKSGFGGSRSNMNTTVTRNLYTWLEGNSKILSDIPSGESRSANKVASSNPKITASMIGVSSVVERSKILNWVNWQRQADEEQQDYMPQGAPIHTKPVVVSYPNKNDVVLINSSDGILHAFNAGDDTPGGGNEIWSFIPQQLLKILPVLKRNSPSTVPEYGLDGPLIRYELMVNKQLRKFAVFGMRRGGRNIYALDITNRLKPELAWQILGGKDKGFSLLGQTWSEPQLLTVQLMGNEARQVLAFGGGYHPGQDNKTSRENDDYANAVFIVDALTGERLVYFTADADDDLENNAEGLSVSVAEMYNGIIGLSSADMNGNGVTDRLYASGIGGRIFRIDLPDNSYADTTITAGIIVDINSVGESFKRFYAAPEVAYYSQGNQRYLSLLIGTGHLPDPLNSSTTDRFYMIKDYAIWQAPLDDQGNVTYVTITEDELFDASKNLLQDGTVSEISDARAELNASKGWYINLESGPANQKVTTKALIFDSVIYFTAYVAARNKTQNICTAEVAKLNSSIYAINLRDGSAALDLDLDKDLDVEDRSKKIITSGLPAGPAIVTRRHDMTGSGERERSIIGLDGIHKLPKQYIQMNWEQVFEQYLPNPDTQ